MLKKMSVFALVALACNTQKATPPKPTPSTKTPETAAVKAPETKPESAPASVASAPAESALQLSLAEPNGSKCDWKKVDPIANVTKVIATFENDCRGLVMTFSKDRSRALAWFAPEYTGGWYAEDKATPPFLKEEGEPADKTQRLYEVEVSTGKVTTLTMPGNERGQLSGISYVSGDVVAFFEEEAKVVNKEVEFEGKKYPVPERDGVPVLVHAMKHNAGKWEIIETAVSDTGWDMALGVKALKAYEGQELPTTEILTEHPPGWKEVEAPVLERLKVYAPVIAERDGEWAQLAPTSFLVWMFRAEFVHATGKIVFDDGSKFIELPGLGFTDGDMVAPVIRGDHMLIAQNGTGRAPRVYDVKTQKLLFSSDTARAAIFWPK